MAYTSAFSASLRLRLYNVRFGIENRSSSGINNAGFTMFYTNLNSADADAKSH